MRVEHAGTLTILSAGALLLAAIVHGCDSETGSTDPTTTTGTGGAGIGGAGIGGAGAEAGTGGTTGSGCSDECTAGDTGCTTALTRWTCADANADGCVELVEADCSTGEHCQGSACTASWSPVNLGVSVHYFDVKADNSGQVHLVTSLGSTLTYGKTNGLTVTDASTITTTANVGILLPPWISARGTRVAVIHGTGQAPGCGMCATSIVAAIREGQGSWQSEEVLAAPDCDLYTYPNLALAGDGALHVFADCGRTAVGYMDYRYRLPGGSWQAHRVQGPHANDFEGRMETDAAGRVHVVRGMWCNPEYYQVAQPGVSFPDVTASDEVSMCASGLAVDGDEVHSAWIHFPNIDCAAGGIASLKHATRAGSTFEPQADVAQIAHCGDYNLPSVAALATGDLAMAWAESAVDDSSAENVWVAFRRHGSVQWNKALVATSGDVARGVTPRAVAVGNTIHVFWRDNQGSLSAVTAP